MKTYKNLYQKFCAMNNLELAFRKARKGKSKKTYVIAFENNLEEELQKLHNELCSFTYKPQSLKRFIVRDPKTRTIHASDFRDRVVYHALVNILEPIFEKSFIYDSYASRKGKGTHKALLRFDTFLRKVSKNGQLINNYYDNNCINGYVFKADIKKYFDTVNHILLLGFIKRKIKDNNIIWLIEKILNNFGMKTKGMPLGNLTSQFFANVYLTQLDYFVKHKLKVRFYLRYVDDFIILHRDKNKLYDYKSKIEKYITNLKLELHLDKSKILPLRKGIGFVGYRVFYHYKLLRKSNKKSFEKAFKRKLDFYKNGLLGKEDCIHFLEGWFGYAQWANTYNYRKNIMEYA